MSDFQHEDREQLTRRQAAERLTDVAYALITGGPLKLGGDQQITVPIADRLTLRRESSSKDGRIEFELELSWSTDGPAPPMPSDAAAVDESSKQRTR
jgi:amphi-Trp domain-containing protein